MTNSISENRFVKQLTLTISVLIFGWMIFSFTVNAQTWTNVNGPWKADAVPDIATGNRTSVSASDTLYAIESTRLLKSVNSAGSWAEVSSPVTSPKFVVCVPNNPQTVLVAQNGTLHLSNNGGNNWSPKNADPNLLPASLHITKGNYSLMFAGYEKVYNYYSLYRSSNTGTDWEYISYFFGGGAQSNGTFTDVSDIATLSSDANKVWAAGSPPVFTLGKTLDSFDPESDTLGGVFYSPDGGDNWKVLGLRNDTISALGVYQYDEDIHLWAVKDSFYSRLFHSTDGNSWSAVSLPVSNVKIYNLKTSGVKVYLATSKGIFIKTGIAWNSGFTKYDTGMFDDSLFCVAISNKDTNRIYAGSYRSIFKSTDNGSNWTDVNTGIKKLSVTSLSAIDTVKYVATATDYPVVWRKNGPTWQTIKVTTGNSVRFEGEKVVFHPTQNNYAFAMGKSGDSATFYRSTDTGKTWTKTKGGNNTSTKFFDAITDPIATAKLYMGGADGYGNIFFANGNYGASTSWEDKSFGSVTTVYSLALDTIAGANQSSIYYAGLRDEGLYKTYNAGSSWAIWDLPGGADESRTIYSVALNLHTPNIVYAGGSNVGLEDTVCLWKSTDRGSNWNAITSRTDTVTRILMHPSYPNSGNYLWVVSANGRKIFKSIDAGTSWTDVTGNLPTPVYDLRKGISNNAEIFAATAQGVYRINPAPEAPTNLHSIIDDPEIQIHPKFSWNASPEADLPTNKYKVYKKKGSGNWLLRATISSPTFTDNTETITGTGEGTTVYYYVKTIDISGNQSPQSNTITFIVDKTSAYKISEHKIVQELPTVFSLSQNYPNPFNPTTVIRYDLPEDAFVSLKIYDMFGSVVITLLNENVARGYHVANSNASNVASGMYFYRLTAKNEDGNIFSETKKMLLMK